MSGGTPIAPRTPGLAPAVETPLERAWREATRAAEESDREVRRAFEAAAWSSAHSAELWHAAGRAEEAARQEQAGLAEKGAT